jgi:uncharacterized protein (TIGR00369 family)
MARPSKPGNYPNADELLVHFNSSNTANQFGFELTKAETGRVVMSMLVDARHLQILGVVHGGVLAALADTAGGLASYMAYPTGTRVVTIEMKINYLEAVERGTLEADARVVRSGKHVAVVDCDVRDENRRLVAKALMTFFAGPLAKKKGKARRK